MQKQLVLTPKNTTMKYRMYVEQCGVFHSYSKWYSTVEACQAGFNEFQKKHIGVTFQTRLEVGEPKSTDIGF